MAAGDSIAEIETDKATMEWEAQDDGFVAKILLEAGAKDIPVGEPALVIVEEEVSTNERAGLDIAKLEAWGQGRDRDRTEEGRRNEPYLIVSADSWS